MGQFWFARGNFQDTWRGNFAAILGQPSSTSPRPPASQAWVVGRSGSRTDGWAQVRRSEGRTSRKVYVARCSATFRPPAQLRRTATIFDWRPPGLGTCGPRRRTPHGLGGRTVGRSKGPPAGRPIAQSGGEAVGRAVGRGSRSDRPSTGQSGGRSFGRWMGQRSVGRRRCGPKLSSTSARDVRQRNTCRHCVYSTTCDHHGGGALRSAAPKTKRAT